MPPKSNDVDIICSKQVSAGPETDIPTAAQDTLHNAIENATCSQTRDRPVYENRLGLELIERRDKQNARYELAQATSSTIAGMVADLEDRIQRLQLAFEGSKERGIGLKGQIQRLQLAIEGSKERGIGLKGEIQRLQLAFEGSKEQGIGLKDEIQRLQLASNGYVKIRHRFLDIFQGDDLKDKSGSSTSSVRAGITTAHGGDAVTDAAIFESGVCEDNGLMITIYGLDPAQVLQLNQENDNDSLSIINARATLASKKDNPIHPDVEDAWNAYIILLKNNWGQRPRDDPTSAFGKGYYQFWDAYKKFAS